MHQQKQGLSSHSSNGGCQAEFFVCTYKYDVKSGADAGVFELKHGAFTLEQTVKLVLMVKLPYNAYFLLFRDT